MVERSSQLCILRLSVPFPTARIIVELNICQNDYKGTLHYAYQGTWWTWTNTLQNSTDQDILLSKSISSI